MTTTHVKPLKDSFETKVTRALRLLPVYILIPVLYWLAFRGAGTDLIWSAFGLGALGWIVALMLRGPLSALSLKLPKERVQKIIVASSGPLEEGVRLALLLITGTGFSWALSIGQGWAAIEVLYTIVQVAAIASLAKKTDEKSMQAKAILEAQGTTNVSPLWGLLERVFASALHIGCTLLVAKYHWLVVILIPLHSGVNFIAVKYGKKSIAFVELFIAIVGTAALAAGLLVFN
jgi:hypothetical protein